MKKKLFPVIHCQNITQTYRNLNIAKDCGADGAFLINHKMPHVFLTLIAEKALSSFPQFPLGINYLDLDPVMALSVLPYGISYLWTDNPGLNESSLFQEAAQTFLDYREAKGSAVCYFGSVAFKYQPAPKSIVNMTSLAAEYMEVVVTSGEATGKPAHLSKIQTMKSVLGNKSLALASGVDSKNVKDYLPYVDDFLVATGISEDFFNLSERKTKELADIIHSYQ